MTRPSSMQDRGDRDGLGEGAGDGGEEMTTREREIAEIDARLAAVHERGQRRASLAALAPTVVCAACGSDLAVANHEGEPALRCGRCNVYGPDTRPRYEPNLKTRYRKARSIDGSRIIAARRGDYAGLDRPVYGPMIKDDDVIGGFHPEWAEQTGYKMVGGQRVPYTAVVYWDERVQLVDEYVGKTKTGKKKPNSMWASQPRGQLSKCAEALMLRKGWPEELSDLEYAEIEPHV